MRGLFALAGVAALLVAACAHDPLVGPATATTDPYENWTDCHDGHSCPPAYPQCPFPGKPWKCQAGDGSDVGPGDPYSTMMGGAKRDAGAEPVYGPEPTRRQ